VEISADEAEIKDLDGAVKILKLLKGAYNGMDEVSTAYNKENVNFFTLNRIRFYFPILTLTQKK